MTNEIKNIPISKKNVIRVFETYNKQKEGHTLIGDLLKKESISREQRQAEAIKTFNILYEKVLSEAKTDFQKAELASIKKEFDNEVKEEMDSWFEWSVSTSGVNKLVNKMLKIYTESAAELAGEIYDHADDNHFSYADKDFRYLLDSIDNGNAIQVAQSAKNHPANKNKESLLRVLAQEYTMPFSNEQQAEKKKQITNFVNSYFTAAGYKDTPYMNDIKKLLDKILNSSDTSSQILTGDIEKLESIMDAVLVKQPKNIANKLFKIIDDNSYAFSRTDIKILMDKVNSSNVNEVMKEFAKLGNKKSLLKMIDEEWGDADTRKAYIQKLVNAQLNASNSARNNTVKEHINASLKNENVADIELLIKSLDKTKDMKYVSKTLFTQLSKDEDNIDKEAVKYLLSGIDSKNIVSFMTEFNKLSGDKPITEFLQKNGNASAQSYIISLTDKLLEANQKSKIFNDENYDATFGILKTDIQNHIRKNIKNKKEISSIINSLLPTTPKKIAKNIKDISSKWGAPDELTFKLWISRINEGNVREIITEYKNANDNETPLNAIIEQRTASKDARQKQALHILASLVKSVGEDNIHEEYLVEFTDKLESELFDWGFASAKDLNKLIDIIPAGIPSQGNALTTEQTTTVENIRPETNISLGEKYGNFTWQYSNLRGIKTLDDVAEFTGTSRDYIKELIKTEGYKNTAYNCSSGKRTIGIGHNFHNAKPEEKKYLETTKLAESEIYQILAYDIFNAIQKLKNNREVDTSKLTQGQYEALLDVSFNAPGYMKDLSSKTNEAIIFSGQGNTEKARKAFDEAAYEFNQQYSNQQIAPGLCKRRVRNLLRYMGVNSFKELPQGSQAQKRAIILAKNGHSASAFYRKSDYTADMCQILGISQNEFEALKYPKD